MKIIYFVKPNISRINFKYNLKTCKSSVIGETLIYSLLNL